MSGIGYSCGLDPDFCYGLPLKQSGKDFHEDRLSRQLAGYKFRTAHYKIGSLAIMLRGVWRCARLRHA